MFLRAFVEIRVPAEAATNVLRRLPQTLVESFAVEAIDHGHTMPSSSARCSTAAAAIRAGPMP